MGALSPTTAKAIAGAASASKSTPTKEKSSGVSSASKFGGSAKDAGSPKQVTPKGPGTSSGKGAVSKVSSTASKVADIFSDSGSYSTKSVPKKESVAKASSLGSAASTKSVGSNTLLMGKDAANDPFSAANNFKAGLDAIGGMFSSPATAPLEGLTNRKVSTYAVDSNGYPIIPSASGTTFLDPGYTQLPDGTWVTEGNLEDYRPNGVGARGVGTAGAAVPNTWTADQVAYQGKQSFLPGATVNKTDGTSYVAAAPGFIAPDMEETRGEQRLSAEQLRALDLASQQRALDGIGVPFVGSAINGIASVADLLRGASPEKQYTEITIPGPGTAGINAASWANAADRVFAPRLPSDRERAAPAPFTPDDAYVGRTMEPNGQVSAPLTSLPASERWGWNSKFSDMAGSILPALGYEPRPPDDMSIDLNMGDVPDPKGLDEAVEPRAFDTLIDNTGRILEHVGGLGIVKALAPDLWNGIGSAFKSIGTGEPNSMLDPTGNPSATYWNPAEGTWTGSDGQVNQPRKGTFSDDHGTYTTRPPFPDLNHNGVDDRKEGYTGPDTRPPPPGTTEPPPTTGGEIPLPVFDLPPERVAQFPTMPPYDPGRSPEFMYFTNNHLADGGMVQAPGYAEGGEIDMADPKVQLIGQTEDVLEKIKGGAKPDEQDAQILKAFVAQFGDAALRSLNDNVGEGLSMKSAGSAGGSGRLIKGEGGPKEDKVPAVIIDEGTEVSPARLSPDEFVMPQAAVAGAGGGDIKVGAERLQQLAERLAQQKGAA